jgi:peptidoglycan hydrolase-like protein with peptidoglycan-binding domain
MLDVVRSQLGYTESGSGWTKFGAWWAERHNKSQEWAREPWCDMFLAWAADQAGLISVVGDSAWTPGHAQWFKDRGRWGHTPRRGAIVFFDWQGSKNIPAIDHVGIVEAVRSNGTIVTIEGNTSNQVKRRERSGLVAGYGYPAYSSGKPAPKPVEPSWTEEIVKTLPLLRRGSRGYDVKTLFYLLHARGMGLNGNIDDTVFGEPLDEALRRFQTEAGLKVDGECGPKTWPKLLRVD